MTGKELKQYFEEHLVPRKLYKIGGKHHNRICLEQSGNGWDVYFSEHKEKIGVTHYDDETSACFGMRNEIRKLMEILYGMTFVNS